MIRPISLYLLVPLHLILGISATAGGTLLIIRPDGSLLGMQLDWLDHSPFKNYFFPGLILLLSNGIFPLFILSGLVIKPVWQWANVFNIFHAMHWAWTYSLYAGIMVIAWIVFQMMMTQYYWIQPVIIIIGLLIIILTMMPGMIKFFQAGNKTFIV